MQGIEFYVSEWHYARLEKMAKNKGLTVQQLIRTFVKTNVEFYEKQKHKGEVANA
jgi:predicted DNA-binding ribbon-helix-helix protein